MPAMFFHERIRDRRNKRQPACVCAGACCARKRGAQNANKALSQLPSGGLLLRRAAPQGGSRAQGAQCACGSQPPLPALQRQLPPCRACACVVSALP